MIPAIKPEIIDAKVRPLVETENLQGFLMSGGSNKLNEINFNVSQDRHIFGDIYETILKELQSAGSSGVRNTPANRSGRPP